MTAPAAGLKAPAAALKVPPAGLGMLPAALRVLLLLQSMLIGSLGLPLLKGAVLVIGNKELGWLCPGTGSLQQPRRQSMGWWWGEG